MKNSVIFAEKLTKKYGELSAVDKVDLSVPNGICFGLLGPNGAGKTTMIQMLQASSPVTNGKLKVLGTDVSKESRSVRKRIGVIPQEDNLDPDFTAEYNLIVYARYFGIDVNEAKEKASKLLEEVGLTDKANEKISNLSGGMKRRLIVARGMINDPELLILDEPTTGLDPQARHSVWDQIRIFKNNGKTVLLTTHYMDEAEILCDELAIMDSGKILIRGTPRELISKTVGADAVELVSHSFNKGKKILDLIETKSKLKNVIISRVSDRIIIYGKEIEEIISEFESNSELTDIIKRRTTLEDVFLKLTGRQLRD
ncbi:ATP-binding cassette domain-containing protein [Marine Group III euryarchaeote]|nr:ATP-binding cassette domain-containing protein [Marine Group III euryarchaeote]